MKQSDLEMEYLIRVQVTHKDDVFKELEDIKEWQKEVFVVFYLDASQSIISREIVSVGILDASLIHPREVFRSAIVRNAHSIIVAHNHPSGEVAPSKSDIETTKHLQKAGDLIGIKVLDHLIFTKHHRYSLHDNGDM